MRYLWLFCLSASLWGQTLNVSHFQDGSASLAGTWKFHAGDDPRWADPNFDDSDWKLVKVPLDLEKQGYTHFSGYGWYRLELRLDAAIAAQDLQLFFGSESGADVYEVYANGHRVGGFGSFPPQERLYINRLLSFAVPKIQRSGQPQLLIAFRFWVPLRLARFPIKGLSSGPIEIGTAAVIQNRVAAKAHREMLRQLPAALVNCVMMLILAIILLTLYSFDRRPEYLFLGLGFTATAFEGAMNWMDLNTFLVTIGQYRLIFVLLQLFERSFTIYGIWSLLETSVGRTTKTLRLLLAFISFDFVFDFVKHWVDLRGGAGAETLSTIGHALSLSLFLTIVIVIFRWSRHVTAQTRWLAVSFIPFYLVGVFFETLSLNYALHLIPALTRLTNNDLRDLTFKLNTIFIITAVAFVYLLLRRFGAARTEQERLHTEMETARQVQQLMLPSQSVTIPNLKIEAVYLPAQEVGGDFFQIAQTKDDSLLLVVGDVSGKGLKAALTVSLIVGLWQDVIDGSEQLPRNVLSWLNEQLLRRVREGFVTCLCVRLSADGSLTIANAGHLAPYINGQELATVNGLPLGLSAEVEYSEIQHVLAPQDTLTLISDGVVEARDKTRKLFGFERLQQVLSEHHEANVIARSAQQFGQEDDITVISISRQAVEVRSPAQTQAASMSVPSPIPG